MLLTIGKPARVLVFSHRPAVISAFLLPWPPIISAAICTQSHLRCRTWQTGTGVGFACGKTTPLQHCLGNQKGSTVSSGKGVIKLFNCQSKLIKTDYFLTILSMPPMYGRRTSGIYTEPSAWRWFSRNAISIRGGATTVLFSV